MPFMTHPLHGANNVSPGDVALQEKAGWKVTERAEWMASKGGVQAKAEKSRKTLTAPKNYGRLKADK